MPTLSRHVQPARIVGKYRIVRVLGRGGTSTVYLAEPQAAVKIAGAYISENRGLREQYVRAASLASGLDHPNIVGVLECGEQDELLWLAMPYIDGPSADAELRAGRMAPVRAARIVVDIASAVDYAHSAGVLHGDLKPTNFLLSQSGSSDERTYLTDFGLIGSAGTVLLSAAYAAPEVLLGRRADGRADVYSLGCSLFRLLTGKPPFFEARSKPETIAAQLHRTPPSASSLAPWLPSTIDEVLAHAMAKDPASRFATARSFALAALFALTH
jgi:serine/threonine-protein kinase